MAAQRDQRQHPWLGHEALEREVDSRLSLPIDESVVLAMHPGCVALACAHRHVLGGVILALTRGEDRFVVFKDKAILDWGDSIGDVRGVFKFEHSPQPGVRSAIGG